MKLNQLRIQLAGFPAAAPASAAPPLIRVAASEKRTLPGMFQRLLPLLLLLSLPAVVEAQFNYYTNNGAITITRYTGPGGAVDIPATINGLPVTSIGAGAFTGCRVTGVTIPSGVTNIGNGAFGGCWMASVTFPSSVTSIGEKAFYSCFNLTSVTIPMPSNGTSIGRYAFQRCTSLESVTISGGVTSIGEQAFHQCSSLTNVTIGGGLTDIGFGVFAACTSLTSVTIPSSVTSIGYEAFGGCNSLASITIPSSVTNLGAWAFSHCTSLTSVTIPGSVTSIAGGTFYNCTSLTNVTITSGVTYIGDSMFFNCTNLTSFTIPNSVINIGRAAFYGCSSLTIITIPDSVSSIGEGAFSPCDSLTAIAVDGNNSTYGSVDGVLFNKSQTALIQCPGGKTGSYTIPSSVIRIENYAFYYCTKLTGVYCQANAPSVGSFAFGGDNTATVYYLPGTTGWGPTFGDRPTAFWSLPYPLILDNSPSFGVRTNRFGFIISWATNIPVVVEASTSLAAPAWSPVATNTLTDGVAYFSDPQWTNYPNRFYRLRSP